jgi:hypothetical protein
LTRDAKAEKKAEKATGKPKKIRKPKTEAPNSSPVHKPQSETPHLQYPAPPKINYKPMYVPRMFLDYVDAPSFPFDALPEIPNDSDDPVPRVSEVPGVPGLHRFSPPAPSIDIDILRRIFDELRHLRIRLSMMERTGVTLSRGNYQPMTEAEIQRIIAEEDQNRAGPSTLPSAQTETEEKEEETEEEEEEEEEEGFFEYLKEFGYDVDF